MGEISEALRRARRDRAEGAAEPETPRSGREPADDVYSASAARHAEEHPPEPARPRADPAAVREPSPPAPSPTAPDAGRPVASTPDDAVELTQEGNEARTSQGVLVDDGGIITDACLQLALRVRKALLDRDFRTVAVVSALRNEGKTTVSCNLALAMASLGRVSGVALVDLDLRRPSVETVLELKKPPHGVEDVLVRGEPLLSARVPISRPRLDVYPCLRGQPKAHELLLTRRFEEMIHELRDRYEVVVFDSPPCLLVPDATIILQHVDCFAPVARAGMTRARNFKKMLETLPRKRMLGGILDAGTIPARRGYYEHYAPDAAAEEAAETAHAG